MVRVLGGLAQHTERSLLVTFAPRTPMLAAMHAIGRLFPRANRAPAVEPVSERAITQRIGADAALIEWSTRRTHRVASGFYISQAMELVRR
jgi:magnesium-protoporphyrin O-methyltransferase